MLPGKLDNCSDEFGQIGPLLLAETTNKLLVKATVSRKMQPLILTSHSSETFVVEAVTLLVCEFGLAMDAVPVTADQVPVPGEAEVHPLSQSISYWVLRRVSSSG